MLLVGADTYDYFDYTGAGSVSFVPTPYASTGDIVSFAPVDPLLADIDFDGFPDLPIGRLTVRTPEELAFVIDKTLQYENSPVAGTALFVADDSESVAPFPRMSDSLVEQLPPGWSADRAYLGEVEVEDAREFLIERLNQGVGLTSFVGHSGPTVWTFDNLFSSADAAALTNTAPTVVMQWGCWNTYHVAPSFDSLANRFLVSGPHGAAAVLGAATLTSVQSEQELGPRVVQRATTPGKLLGDAVQEAKAELILERPDLLDVILGWTLLGDPTLTLGR